MSDVQALVDALASELGRPVAVDDQHLRSIAYSSHPETVDSVRLASILQREAPQPVRAWLDELGIERADSYLRVPGNPGLAMAARVCIPLRFDDVPLGYLWLIDEPAPLGAEQLEEATRYAAEFEVALYRDRLLERDNRRLERELVGQLIGLRSGDRAAAAAELLRAGHLVKAPVYAVLSVSAFYGDGRQVDDGVLVRLVDAAEQVRRVVAPHHLLVLVDGDEVVLVLASATDDEPGRRGEAVVAASAASEASGWRIAVGVSAGRRSLDDLAAAYGEAHAAARVGTTAGYPDVVVRWDGLGADRVLVELLGDRKPADLLPASLRRLLGSAEGLVLVETLERYLDLGGDARAAAEALYLHRSSLYGRLRRIEEVSGIDLRSGDDRLEAHLGVRLWRLGGSRPSI
jgi:sugar diacid utilization regulator